ncbi:MAG: BMP family ABC transporter substrate-binding protein [Erysipelotrichaceae bacterium]|nr:BMP family ABC transporter substrate-binding protein [Erysipelotrichaceae bacterium]
MKKLLTVLLAVFMVFALAACGGKTEDGGNTGGGSEKSAMELAKEAGKITIANVVNGTLGDKSFFDSGEEAMQWINRDYGDKAYGQTIELTYDTATWQTGLEEVFKQGWDIIIAGTYDMKEYIIPLIEEYPDQKIWFYDEEWNFNDPDGWQYAPSDNLYAMLFAQNEGSYVAGYMAATLSQTGKIAFMGGMDNSVLDDFYVGFAQGAKAANPDIDVKVAWMNSFSDVAAGKDCADGLYNTGYDVVFACGGQAGLGGFDKVIATPEGNYIIGVDGDQGSYFASLGTDEGNAKAARCITSMKKNVNQGFYSAFQMELEGKVPYGTNKKLGLNGGYVSCAVTDTTKNLFTEDQLATFAKVADDIANGTTVVDSAFNHTSEDNWFYGTFVPQYDSTSGK